MKPLYKFHIRKDSTLYYYVDSATKTVQTSDTRVQLDPLNEDGIMPDWMTFSINFKRLDRYRGVYRTYTPDTVRFVEDAAQILRYISNNYGVNGIAQLEVWKLNKTTQEYEYMNVYDIDLSVNKSMQYYFDAPIMESGIPRILQGYDKSVYDVIIDNPVNPGSVSENILFTPMALLNSYNYQSDTSLSVAHINVGGDTGEAPGSTHEEGSFGTLYINQEGTYSVGVPKSVLVGSDGAGEFPNSSLYQQTQDVISTTVNIGLFGSGFLLDWNWSVAGTPPPTTNYLKLELQLNIYSSPNWDSVTASHVLWANSGGFVIDGTYGGATGPLTWTGNIPTGSYVVLQWKATVQNPTVYTERCMVTITSPMNVPTTIINRYKAPDVPVWSLTWYQVFQKLVRQLGARNVLPTEPPAPGTYPTTLPDVTPYEDDYTPPYTVYEGKSDLLQTDIDPGENGYYDLNPAATRFVSGDALRGLFQNNDGNYDPPKIRTTFADFAQDAFVSACAGIGVEKDGSGNDIVRLEHLRHFFDADTLICDLGSSISNFSMSPYTQDMGNNIKFGYADQSYDDVNGKFEFNTEYGYRSPLLPVLKDVDYKSPYRADMYGASFTSVNLSGKTTTDAGSDNDTFKIACNISPSTEGGVTGYFPAPPNPGTDVTINSGIPDSLKEYVFNLPLAVCRQIARMMPFLKSTYTVKDPNIYLQSCKKNKNVASVFDGSAPMNDYGNKDLSTFTNDYDSPLWKPKIFSFEAEPPADFAAQMTTSPYGVIGFTLVDDRIPDGSTYMEGFVLEAGYTPGNNDKYNFKLLCSPNTTIPDNI